jgi:hypothetical protein
MNKIKVNGHEVPADALLAALHNNAKSQGLGQLQDIRRNLTREEARKMIEESKSKDTGEYPPFEFDWFLGRPLKVYQRIEDDVLEGRLYDRDNGEGSFARAVEQALAMEEP